MRFRIDIHPADHVLEIVYPQDVTAEDVSAYTKRCRELIQLLGRRWSCLVDQTSGPVLPRGAAEEIAALNTFALANGMQRCARVVSGAVGELQAWRITRDVKDSVPVRTFANTAEAWAWIREAR
jgi:hypothetical protein